MSRAISQIAASCALAALLLASSSTKAAVVGYAIGPRIADRVNVSSITFTTGGFSVPVLGAPGLDSWVSFSDNDGFGDDFGLTNRDAAGAEAQDAIDPTPSFSFLDDSAGGFPGDEDGTIAADDFDNFFAVQDLDNGDTGTDTQFTSTWEFDITGASGGLTLSVDAAASFDWEARDEPFNPDVLDFAVSFDGVNFTDVITSGILDTSFTQIFNAGGFTEPIDTTLEGQDLSELPADVIYDIDGGLQVAWNDPLTLNGEVIKNEFETISADLGEATSNTLYVRFTAQTGSGGETFLLRNLTVEDGGVVDPGLMADFNGDGTVDLLDLDILGQNFGNPGDMSMGDANGDGQVDLIDLDILGMEFGMGGSSTSVPEPASAALLALAALGLAPRRR